MKKTLVSLFIVFVLASCAVKSLQPFYLTKHIKFDKRLLGTWTDQGKSTWEIKSFQAVWDEDTKNQDEITEEDLLILEKYKNSYLVNHISKGKEATFIATPFMVDQHLFLNLNLFEFSAKSVNNLAVQNLLKTHSAAYVEVTNIKNIQLKFLAEKTVRNLMKEGKLRLNHELTGIDEDLILTARSEELHAFLKKFMKSNSKDKWEDDDIYTLKITEA
ncbi:MAG: hypothetical protein WBG46_07495 [Nonlabens sp.]